MVWLWARTHGAHTIYDAHEDLVKQIETKRYLHPQLKPFARIAAKVLVGWADRGMDAIVAATPEVAAGFTASMNYDLFSERMMTLPVFVYTQYANQGPDSEAFLNRAWTGALVLILIVMALNLSARLIAKAFAPKLGR